MTASWAPTAEGWIAALHDGTCAYFEVRTADGAVLDAWSGGGIDLPPYQPWEDDPAHFHAALRQTCDAHDPAFYPRFKSWCDEYFVNTHRGGSGVAAAGCSSTTCAPARMACRRTRPCTPSSTTAARIESVRMLLPPLAAWDYDPVFAPGSAEARLLAMLAPREWA